MWDERLDPDGEGGDAMYHSHRDKSIELWGKRCGGCRAPFTPTEAEFAVVEDNKTYHSRCHGRYATFETEGPE